VNTPIAKLVALVCIAIQAMIGGGVGAGALGMQAGAGGCCCREECCEIEAPTCCKQEPVAPARPSCCCSVGAPEAPAQPAQRTSEGTLKQLRFTPSPVFTLAWASLPRAPTLATVDVRHDEAGVRAACGISTTRLLV
jgi:hypothetical protein